MRLVLISLLILISANPFVIAKDQPFQVVSCPESGQPVLRFTFSKFNSIGTGMGKERTYISDVMAENLSDKTITGANFSLYLFDKGKARIGEGYINLNNVAAGETIKFQITIAASGSPVRWLWQQARLGRFRSQ